MPNNYENNLKGCVASIIDHYSACGQNNPTLSLEYMLLEHRIKQCFVDLNSTKTIAQVIESTLLEEDWRLPECSCFEKQKAWLRAMDHFVSELEGDQDSQLVSEAKLFMDSF